MNKLNIVRSDDLRTENRHRILKTLRKQGPMSRAEIGKATSLSQAALSTLFGLMAQQGVVTSENHNVKQPKRGRPKTTVALDPTAALAVTVALTIDQLNFSVINYAAETVAQVSYEVDTRALNTAELHEKITAGVIDVTDQCDAEQLRTICVGFQGVIDTHSGDLLWSPILSMDKVPLGKLLQKQYGVPVSVHNDCGLIATALYGQENKKLGDSFAAVLFSHGIGLGMYLGGVPFNGAHSSALELGHVQYERDGALCRCGRRGCIEAYAADYGILRSAKGLSPDEIPSGSFTQNDMRQLVDAATKQSEPELNAFKLAGKAIGFGLSTVYTLLDPLPVALVGQNTEAISLMRADIEHALMSVGRSPTDYSTLLHCYQQDTPLMHDGLVTEAMNTLDRFFAENAHEDELEDALS